jgi:hypothetical protein
MVERLFIANGVINFKSNTPELTIKNMQLVGRKWNFGPDNKERMQDRNRELNKTVQTYQQMETRYSPCCKYGGLHADICIMVLCHATLCASSKFQTPQR